jgi:hypothetical protein
MLSNSKNIFMEWVSPLPPPPYLIVVNNIVIYFVENWGALTINN